MKIHSRRESQNIAFNHSSDIDYKDFMKIYRNCTKEPADNPMRFRNNFSDPPL